MSSGCAVDRGCQAVSADSPRLREPAGAGQRAGEQGLACRKWSWIRNGEQRPEGGKSPLGPGGVSIQWGLWRGHGSTSELPTGATDRGVCPLALSLGAGGSSCASPLVGPGLCPVRLRRTRRKRGRGGVRAPRGDALPQGGSSLLTTGRSQQQDPHVLPRPPHPCDHLCIGPHAFSDSSMRPSPGSVGRCLLAAPHREESGAHSP